MTIHDGAGAKPCRELCPASELADKTALLIICHFSSIKSFAELMWCSVPTSVSLETCAPFVRYASVSNNGANDKVTPSVCQRAPQLLFSWCGGSHEWRGAVIRYDVQGGGRTGKGEKQHMSEKIAFFGRWNHYQISLFFLFFWVLNSLIHHTK